MKKVLLVTNMITLCALYFQACTPSGQWFKADTNGSFVLPNQKGYTSCYNCAVDDLHYQTPAKFADVVMRYQNTTKYLSQRYKQGVATNAFSSLSPDVNSNFVDAQSCWFAADTLKKFICLMEKYASQKGVSIGQLGVRFYYGNYANASSMHAPHNPAYAGLHTIFLVPTVMQVVDGLAVQQDFDPRASVGLPKREVMTLAALMATRPNQAAMVLAPSSFDLNMNDGDLCPPGNGCRQTLTAAQGMAGSAQ
jgi:hypothetical protein